MNHPYESSLLVRQDSEWKDPAVERRRISHACQDDVMTAHLRRRTLAAEDPVEVVEVGHNLHPEGALEEPA